MIPLSRRLGRFDYRLNRLEETISSAIAAEPISFERAFIVERALIQIHAEWDSFVRNVVLDSATGYYRSSAGRAFSRAFGPQMRRECAAHILVAQYKKRSFEPDWYLPRDAIDAANLLQLSNANSIAAELGVNPWPLDELRFVRNYIAHKSKRSALKLRNEGLFGKGSQIDVISYALGYDQSGAMRYMRWIGSAKSVAKRLTA